MSTQPFRDTGTLRITDQKATETGDPVFTLEEVKRMDTKLLRKLAAEANTDVVHGKSTRLEQISFFACQKTLDEY